LFEKEEKEEVFSVGFFFFLFEIGSGAPPLTPGWLCTITRSCTKSQEAALENPELTPILYSLITETSLPLKSVEVDFAADSSGFTTSRFVRWFDHKYGTIRQQHEWVKVHLMCGVRTNIVTAVEIRDKDASDTKLLPDLVDTTAKNFTITEISADKGYGSVKNYKAIQRRGAVPYIAFKSIHTGRAEGLWKKMFHYFQFRRDEFLAHYHKRSNVESTFSMIKAKFGDNLRSKTDVAMVNEALCKIICHNICCLIQEEQELGITTEFWANQSTPR
jgi:transposase